MTFYNNYRPVPLKSISLTVLILVSVVHGMPYILHRNGSSYAIISTMSIDTLAAQLWFEPNDIISIFANGERRAVVAWIWTNVPALVSQHSGANVRITFNSYVFCKQLDYINMLLKTLCFVLKSPELILNSDACIIKSQNVWLYVH